MHVGKCLHTAQVQAKDGEYIQVEVFEPTSDTPVEYLNPLLDLILPDTVAHWPAVAEREYLLRTLRGEFVPSSLDLFFAARVMDEIVAVVGYQVSRTASDLGSFGWVHTRPDHRGRGISSLLTQLALRWFRDNGGLCLHLGTVNPVAHHIYAKSGFRDYNGIVMRYVAPPSHWEGFDDELYDPTGPAKVRPATWGDAASLGALYAAPNPWFIKDLAEGLLSHPSTAPRRYVSVPASLLLRVEQSGGVCLLLENPGARVVGAANLIPTNEALQAHVHHLEFLVHPTYGVQVDDLLAGVIEAARDRDARFIRTHASSPEEEKKLALKESGFRQTAVLPAQFRIGPVYRDLEVYTLELE